jgi:dephospho-CoA kinase
MRVLGLTGGIGSGKSMVAEMFVQLGAEVIDADRLARDVVEPGQPALEEIIDAFGRDILLPDGSLNRARLAAIIFADAAARQRLNAITHPRIGALMEREVTARNQRSGVLIVEIPLLYENGLAGSVEKVIVVWVDPETQVQRLTGRDRLSVDEARRRMAAQMALDDKRARADHVIDNNDDRESTRRQVEAIYRRYAPTEPAPR